MNSKDGQQPQPQHPVMKFKKFKNVKKYYKPTMQDKQDKQKSVPILIQPVNTNDKEIMEKLNKLQASIRNMIETQTRYYVDQRIGIMYNSNILFTRGTASLNIIEDASHGGKSLIYRNNGEAVITMTDTGYIYCKNIMLNGLDLYKIINSIYNDIAGGASIYVKHTDLKSGTYDMDVNDIVLRNKLSIQKPSDSGTNAIEIVDTINPDDPKKWYRLTSKGVSLIYDKDMVAGDVLNIMRFGKSQTIDQGFLIRYHYQGTGENVNYISIAQQNRLDSIHLHKYFVKLLDGNELVIEAPNNTNNKYYITCRNTASDIVRFQVHRRGIISSNVANYGTWNKALDMYCPLTSGKHLLLQWGESATAGNACYLAFNYVGNNDIGNYFSISFVNYDNIFKVYRNQVVSSEQFVCDKDISCNGLYSSDNATIDGSVLCTQLDVANYTKNDWYAKFRVEDYLGNGDYIRMILKDLGGQANIDLTHDTQYYGLRLSVPTANVDDNKLCIWPTGVTIDGDLDCYDNVTIWENLEVAKDITMHDTYKLYTNYIYPIPNTGNTIDMTGSVYILDGALAILNNNVVANVYKSLLRIGKYYSTNNISFDYYYDANDSKLCGWRMSYTNNGTLLSGDGYETKVYTTTLNHMANATNVTHIIGKGTDDCMKIVHTIDYNKNPVTFKLSRYNLAETDMLKLYSGNVEVPDGIALKLNNKQITTVATSSDIGDTTKVNNNTIPTTAYCDDKYGTAIHQQVPKDPYASVGVSNNPYLQWHITQCSDTFNTNTDAVCYSEELHQFVILGNSGIAFWSYDGMTWKYNSINNYTWTGVVYGSTYGYIACTSSNMFILSSTDGKTWVPHNNASLSTGCAIAYGNEYYAIVPDGNNAAYLAYSTNPTVYSDWSSYWLGSNRKWYDIAYSKKQHKFMVVGSSGNYVLINDDFSDSTTGQLSGVTNDCTSVCYCEKYGLWVIAVDNDTNAYYSTDGVTFNSAALPYQTNWHRVAYGGDRFIMTSSGSTSAAYSLYGVTWYPFDVSPSGSYSNWLGLAYGNGMFILSGNNNTAPANSIISTYTVPNAFMSPYAMLNMIYPIGSIYMSMVNINPGVLFGGSWTEIQNRFLYCVPTNTSSKAIGGSATHNHNLKDTNAHAQISFHNNGTIRYHDQTVSSWTSDYKVNTGGSGSYENYNDPYGTGVFGRTEDASSLPPYITVYAWYRTG